MKALIQRVARAEVQAAGATVSRIDTGILIFLGVEKGDGPLGAELLAGKVAHLRIFEDDDEKMNLSVIDIGGSALVISQFTLCADTRKGRRPSFTNACDPLPAQGLYMHFVKTLRSYISRVEMGIFQAAMSVHLVNQGPATFLIEQPPVRGTAT